MSGGGGSGCPLLGASCSRPPVGGGGSPGAQPPKLMAPALLVVPDSSPLTRRRWSSGGMISPRSPVTPREVRGGGGLSPDLLSADRPETPEGERLDLRAIGAAVSALLSPSVSFLFRFTAFHPARLNQKLLLLLSFALLVCGLCARLQV
ncbi:hypothetical protein HPB48_005313 [Haemaphysalis longicornis]|uniref:Uncharacterized protein n=1 Tax=Haemaphysalis longicornis TaxID=44386 RepID=A0A9J6GI64_HAELO|nr:hypothetical protein HPB48_005313 [Haemaphysalis longicornis]